MDDEGSEETAMEPLFHHGDMVVRRNRRDERGTVQGSALELACRNFYRVVFPSSPNPVQIPEGDLEKVTFEMSLQERLLNGEFGDQSTFSRLLTYERLRRPLQDTLYSLKATRTEFQAYQFKPLLKFLRSAKHSGHLVFTESHAHRISGVPVQATPKIPAIRQTATAACGRSRFGQNHRGGLHCKPPSYIRMLDGTIRNLRAEQQKREDEIEELRSVTAEHVPIATGILRVL